MTDSAMTAARPAGAASAAGTVPADATWRDYVDLLKPRVMTLVVFTGAAGLLLAPVPVHPVLALAAVTAIALAAGAAGAINMWYDRDIDAMMSRTAQRPLVRGVIAPPEALVFGVLITGLAVMLMGLALNWQAAALLALASAFYVFVYTVWLKRRTPQNIVIGGAAGAFPPMIGWAAATGEVSATAAALFVLIFLWTPPHFWALALYRAGDYARAGVPMLPVVAGAAATKRQIVGYALAMLPVSLLPTALGATGLAYAVAATALGLLFIACAVKLWRDDGPATGWRAAKLLFGYSIFHLFALFGLMVADRVGAV